MIRAGRTAAIQIYSEKRPMIADSIERTQQEK